jgi:hypothetical protein
MVSRGSPVTMAGSVCDLHCRIGLDRGEQGQQDLGIEVLGQQGHRSQWQARFAICIAESAWITVIPLRCRYIVCTQANST